MKTIISITSICAALFLYACATSNYSVGNDFSSSDVKKIEKGKTTSSQILMWFGMPYMKTVVSKNSEKWIYTYSAGTATSRNYIVTSKIETDGVHKVLDILFENDVVINYTFSEGPALKTTVN